MDRRRVWGVVCGLVMLSTALWIGFAEAHATSFGYEATSDVVDLIDDRREQPPEEWLTYESEKGGYSFSYPATYTVIERPSGKAGLYPPAVDRLDGIIGFNYLAYELDDVTDDLVEWVDLYNLHYGELAQPTASRADLAHLHKEGSQQVIIETPETSSIYVYGYLFTNGKLVWRLFTNSTDEADKQLVDKIAETVQFSEDAPLDMRALYAPDAAPMISSVEDMIEFHREGELVQEAYRIRADTGETPTELLEQMSERARLYYELTLENNASALQARDEQRASPPPEVEYTEEDYQSYLKSEEDYANGTLVPTNPEDGERLEDGTHMESGEFRQYLPGLFSEFSSTMSRFDPMILLMFNHPHDPQMPPKLCVMAFHFLLRFL